MKKLCHAPCNDAFAPNSSVPRKNLENSGAVQALNLDGGGSSAMVVGGALVNRPSDAAGERPVGDTIQVLPRVK
ncbi:phosphodiester glycosidase family protein [Sphaerisporangium sp. NPDC051017]|uniref:phosphodiester glycosidase family protein n=1 Tax=Sphaerisporangium sp. NPDC051017 TaxID=3154636 RepID=UPI00341E90BA